MYPVRYDLTTHVLPYVCACMRRDICIISCKGFTTSISCHKHLMAHASHCTSIRHETCDTCALSGVTTAYDTVLQHTHAAADWGLLRTRMVCGLTRTGRGRVLGPLLFLPQLPSPCIYVAGAGQQADCGADKRRGGAKEG